MKQLVFLFCLLINGAAWAQQKNAAVHPPRFSGNPPGNLLCMEGAPDKMIYSDYKDYLLITNSTTGQRSVYWKKKGQLSIIETDTTILKHIYLDFLQSPAQYRDYLALSQKEQFRPVIKSLCAYNDSTVLGCLVTYRIDTVVTGRDVNIVYTSIPSILELHPSKAPKVFFVRDSMPLISHYLDFEMFADKHTVYFSLVSDYEEILSRRGDIFMLASMKKHKSIYSVDQVLPVTMNHYLIANKIFNNYNRYYCSNGYVLMSLSDKMLKPETGEEIKIPIADSIFRKLRMNPETYTISYLVCDFKYNKEEDKCYILYALNHKAYVASFRPGAKTFDTNVPEYPLDGDFSWDMGHSCLSWDGKRVIYSMKGDHCLRYGTIDELQQAAKAYKRPAGK